MILFGTGHRPEDLGAPEDEVYAKARAALLELAPSEVITGMAAGFDLIFGCAALDLGIAVTAAKPWAGHSPRRGCESQYARIIEGASKVVEVVNRVPYPGPWVYPVRNHWMVDNSNAGLAYWNGKQSGGTYECLEYAHTKFRKVTNCYAG